MVAKTDQDLRPRPEELKVIAHPCLSLGEVSRVSLHVKCSGAGLWTLAAYCKHLGSFKTLMLGGPPGGSLEAQSVESLLLSTQVVISGREMESHVGSPTCLVGSLLGSTSPCSSLHSCSPSLSQIDKPLRKTKTRTLLMPGSHHWSGVLLGHGIVFQVPR